MKCFVLDIIKDFKGSKEKHDITYKNAFMVGLFQVVALLPGISRSGATIVGGMFQNCEYGKQNEQDDFRNGCLTDFTERENDQEDRHGSGGKNTCKRNISGCEECNHPDQRCSNQSQRTQCQNCAGCR